MYMVPVKDPSSSYYRSALYSSHIHGWSIVELGRSQVVGGVVRGWGVIKHKYVFM